METQQYCGRLETAIREQQLFPQIQTRVSELEEEQGADSLNVTTQSKLLEEKIKLDELSRQVKEKTLESQALEGELEETKELVKEKDLQLERIYEQLKQKKPDPVVQINQPLSD